jgi:nitroreductase
MFDALEIIQKRISVRSYSEKPVSETLQAKLRALCEASQAGPFGTPVRFRLLDLEAMNRVEAQRLGTYGVIRGARLFILGAVMGKKRGMEDLGYCMERIVLEATAMGLGTCWLGGTFRRSSFAERMQLAAGELLPAITPVGYPAAQVYPVDRIFRAGARARSRKRWEELFFTAGGRRPLAPAEAGSYRDVLEAVRQGPSASNRQPWRLLRDADGIYHLYLKEDRLYNRALGKIRLQKVDMGIAMCHFELAARQREINGRWQEVIPAEGLPGLEYIATWLPG